jgi:transposase
MGQLEGAARTQQILFPEALDDYVAEANPARFLDAFGDSLDRDALGFRHTPPAATGRPSYAPGALRKLYIYGDLHRIRSSRRLEQDTHRNVERRWLLRKLHPDFKTMADVRKDKATAFTQVFRACALLGKEWGLFGQERVALDGPQLKAVTRKRRNFTQAKRRETLTRLDTPIEPYVRDWDAADAAATERQQPTAAQRCERQGRYEGLMREMERTGQCPVSSTDPDSRAMPKRPTVDVGYHAPVAVDDTPKLVVVQDVTQAVTDVGQLSGIAIQAKEALEVDQVTVVAAMGDAHGEDINACEEAGMEP